MRAGRVLRAGFLLVAGGLLVAALVEYGPAAAAAGRDIGPWPVVAALVAALAGLFASALLWRTVLTDLGAPLALRPTLQVYFVGQLGKYVPGSVASVAAQMELGRDQGLSRSRVGAASLLCLGFSTAAGLLISAAALSSTSREALGSYAWALAILPLGLVALAPPVLNRLVAVALRLLRRDPLERPLSWRGTTVAVGWALAVWAAHGVHLWLLVRTMQGAAGPALFVLCVGSYALAACVGLIAVFAPAGGVVREAVLVLALSPVLEPPAALAIAVLSRVLMTLGDLGWALTGAWLCRPRGSSVRPRDAAPEQLRH